MLNGFVERIEPHVVNTIRLLIGYRNMGSIPNALTVS